MKIIPSAVALGIAATFLTTSNAHSEMHRPSAQLLVSMPSEIPLDAPPLSTAASTWRTMIQGATRSIEIAQFYVFSQPGGAIEPIIADLEAAGRRGVRIRFLLSNAMVENDTITLARLRAIPGLTLRLFDLEHRTGGILHAKYWIVDGETLYVGSQNFDDRSLTEIQELGLLVNDRALAKSLGRIFALDWRLAALPVDLDHDTSIVTRRSNSSNGRTVSGDIELVASPPSLNPRGIRAAEDALIELISSATTSLEIQLLTYNPVTNRTQYWSRIDAALRAAAVRGVKVRLLVAHWNTTSPGIDHLKSLSLVPKIEIRIVTIPEHSSGFIPFARVIHSKYMVVDNVTLWVGTSNWSHDYFERMRNIELIVRRSSLAVEALGLFESLWKSAYAVPVDVNRVYPRPRRG